MDRKDVKQDGRVWGLKEVIIKVDFINPDYKIIPHSHSKITKTGLLTIAKLSPLNHSFPEFIFRLDENKVGGSYGELDVDIYIKGKRNNTLWEKGYKGHHTERIASVDGRVFKVEINSPSVKIFTGFIKFSVIRAVIADFKIVCKIGVIEKYIKGKEKD